MSGCRHASTGVVTSSPGATRAVAPVCDLPECIEEAAAWVQRMTYGRPALYVRTEVWADEQTTAA